MKTNEFIRAVKKIRVLSARKQRNNKNSEGAISSVSLRGRIDQTSKCVADGLFSVYRTNKRKASGVI